MWARQQCDSFTLGLPVDRWRLELLPQHNWSDCLKTTEKSSSPRRLLLSVNQTCAKHTHTHIQRHARTHTHIHRNYRLPLFWQKKKKNDIWSVEKDGDMICDVVWVLRWPSCWSCALHHTPTVMWARSWITEAFRESHKWQEKKKSICVSFTSALACDKSSPPNADATSAASVFFNANPQKLLQMRRRFNCHHQVSFWLRTRRKMQLLQMFRPHAPSVFDLFDAVA